MASPKRCFMPKENPLARLRPVSDRPTWESRSAHAFLGLGTPSANARAIMLSIALIFGNTPGFSISTPTRCTMPPDCRAPARAFTGRPNTSTPPSSGEASPAIIFIAVDLPAPFLPTNP